MTYKSIKENEKYQEIFRVCKHLKIKDREINMLINLTTDNFKIKFKYMLFKEVLFAYCENNGEAYISALLSIAKYNHIDFVKERLNCEGKII